MIKRLVLILILSLFIAQNAHGFDAARPNNKFGIHIAQVGDEDVQDSEKLVNSGGGKWGYITVVLQENDRNITKWQGVFDNFRTRHLIPIVRIATQPQGAAWRKPTREDIAGWVSFLNSLNWVTRDRYVALFNEPNHAGEWGGSVDPAGYGEIADDFARALKAKNPDFFVMLAGLDAAAPSAPPQYEDERVFLEKMKEKRPDIFDHIDGWSSHSYPNPGFVGTPFDTGRNSIRNYEWELQTLKSIGVDKNLPVFITETGWPHSGSGRREFFTPDEVAQFIKGTYANIWLTDSRVRAVTPFILNYQDAVFGHFSWRKLGSHDFYPQYGVVQGMDKVTGDPEQIERGAIVFDTPSKLTVNSNYRLFITLKNEGQAMWDVGDGYNLDLAGVGDHKYFFSDISSVLPHEEQVVDLAIKTDNKKGAHNTKIFLKKGDREIMSIPWNFTIIPLPSLKVKVHLVPKIRRNFADFEIQLFDANEQLVFKKKGLKDAGGVLSLNAVPNVLPGRMYRLVVLKPYFLPRQTHIVMGQGSNTTSVKSMWPLDPNRNGRIDLGDIGALIANPLIFRLLIP